MSLFSRRQSIKDNRIENLGRWPIRLTDFFLVDEYEFPPSQYAELFLVREGHFLHETENGTQAVRAGTAMVHHPSSRHVVKQPEQVRISRIRLLPEWFAGEYDNVMDAPDVLGLFFARHWFEIPEEENLQVFTTRDNQAEFLASAFDFLAQCLRTGRHLESISRITLFEILMMFGDEYHVYWRGGNRIPLDETVTASLEIIERAASSGARMPLKRLESETKLSQEDLSQALRKAVGLTLVDYMQRRRLHHAARRLLATEEEVGAVSELFAFNDEETFSREFERLFQFVPSVYREKYGSGNGNGNGAKADNA